MTPCIRWPQTTAHHPVGMRGLGAGVGPSCRANLRLLSEEDLGLTAAGNLRRDLWWWRHLEGAKG